MLGGQSELGAVWWHMRLACKRTCFLVILAVSLRNIFTKLHAHMYSSYQQKVVEFYLCELWPKGGSLRSLHTNHAWGKIGRGADLYKLHLGKNFAAMLGGQSELGAVW